MHAARLYATEMTQLIFNQQKKKEKKRKSRIIQVKIN